MKKFFILHFILTSVLSSPKLHAYGDNYYQTPQKFELRSNSFQSLEATPTYLLHPAFKGLNAHKIVELKKQFRKTIPSISITPVLQNRIQPYSFQTKNKTQPFSRLPNEDTLLAYFLQTPDSTISRNLEFYESQDLQSGSLNSTPWSDSYWPIYKGILGQRYADEEFENVGRGNFRRYFNFVNQPGNGFLDLTAGITDANEPRLLNISPSEKYDLLLGDARGTLTQSMWADGLRYEDAHGNVESWMGICHGWAIAAYFDARPLHQITVLAFDGKTPVTFYPSDLKGLLSLLWANARVPSMTLGNRCDEKNPRPGPDGRLTHPECEDVHPGLWHLAVINKIGIQKESFVMDSMWDFEVWNQPVLSYSIEYFDPSNSNTNESSLKFKEVMATRRSYGNDPYARYRSARAKYIVGVKMQLDYATETLPNHKSSDSPEDDRRVRVIYVYDLELDKNFDIVGGEWRQRQHPDFLWTAPRGSLAWTRADRNTQATWDGSSPIPEELRREAFLDSGGHSAEGLPLGKIVRRLVNLSRQ